MNQALTLQSNLQEVKSTHIKLNGIFEAPDPRQGDLGALLNTEYEDWLFLESVVFSSYSDAQKEMWQDQDYMKRAFNLLRAYIANKLIKKPELVQQFLDLLFLMYRDVKKAEVDAKKREEEDAKAKQETPQDSTESLTPEN